MDAIIGFVLGLVGAIIEFFGALFGGLLVFGVLGGSVMLIFSWADERYGRNHAVWIMFAWFLVGLPLFLKMLDLAVQVVVGL